MVDQQHNLGHVWMLSMPSSFMQCPSQSAIPAILSPPPSQKPMHLTAIPLSQGHDVELSVLHIIAQVQGHDPLPKIAGAYHYGVKSKSKKAKRKEKEKEKKNAGTKQLKKQSHCQYFRK